MARNHAYADHEIVERAHFLECSEKFDGPYTNGHRLVLEMRDGSFCQPGPSLIGEYFSSRAAQYYLLHDVAEAFVRDAHKAANAEGLYMHTYTPIYFVLKKRAYKATRTVRLEETHGTICEAC
jgi:hypothetical protein